MSPPPSVKEAAAALRRPAEARSLAEDPALESSLSEGAESYSKGRVEEAHGSFQKAHRLRPSDPRCLAWFGLTLIRVERNNNLGVRYCEEAVRGLGAGLPLTWLCLGRAFMALGYRDRAIRALQRGLDVDPAQLDLVEEIARLGVRRRPVLPFLPRSNPLNRALGRLRSRMSHR